MGDLNDDMKKLFESDFLSKIKFKTGKERAQVLSNLLGRNIPEEESNAIISDINSIKIQALTKQGLKDLKKGIESSLKEKRYPRRAGSSTYRAQG